jgi:hypothetical protein
MGQIRTQLLDLYTVIMSAFNHCLGYNLFMRYFVESV